MFKEILIDPYPHVLLAISTPRLSELV